MKVFSMKTALCMLFFIVIVFVGAFLFLGTPADVHAQFGPFSGDPLVPCDTTVNPQECGVCHVRILAQNIINILVFLAIIVAVLMFVYAGFLYVTGVANPGNIEKAHKIFWAVFMGLFITLASWLIIDTVMKAFYRGNDPNSAIRQGFGPWNEIKCVAPKPAPKNCTLPASLGGSTVVPGSIVTAYEESLVLPGSTCVSESRTCDGITGNLSGTFIYPSCTVTIQTFDQAYLASLVSPNTFDEAQVAATKGGGTILFVFDQETFKTQDYYDPTINTGVNQPAALKRTQDEATNDCNGFTGTLLIAKSPGGFRYICKTDLVSKNGNTCYEQLTVNAKSTINPNELELCTGTGCKGYNVAFSGKIFNNNSECSLQCNSSCSSNKVDNVGSYGSGCSQVCSDPTSLKKSNPLTKIDPTIISTSASPSIAASLSVDKSVINLGDSVLVTWSSTPLASTDRCDGVGFNTGGAKSGSVTIKPPLGSNNLTVTCTSVPSGGLVTTDSDLEVVNVFSGITASLTASKSNITLGESVTLTWAGSPLANIATCFSTDFGVSGKSGSTNITPPSVGTHTFKVTCQSNKVGFTNAEASVTIDVIPAPIEWCFESCKVGTSFFGVVTCFFNKQDECKGSTPGWTEAECRIEEAAYSVTGRKVRNSCVEK